MSFNRKYFNIFKNLLPKSNAFNIIIQKNLTKFFEGLTALPDDFRTYINNIFLDIFPLTTRSPELWENQFGIRFPNADDTIRRNQIDRSWKLKGGQSAKYLQDQLQEAGFDVQIHENNPKIDPDIFLNSQFIMTCGNSWAVCGNDNALCGRTGGYLLVNGFIPDSSDIRDYLAVCGGDTGSMIPTFCGQSTAVCGYFEAFFVYPKTYTIPDDPNYWDFIFFIGGDAIKISNIFDPGIQLTTFSANYLAYCNNNIIVYTNFLNNKMYKKSILDIDNETNLTTYQASHNTYIGNDEIVFRKTSDGLMYKKSIFDIDNEIKLTTYQIVYNEYAENNIILFLKSGTNHMYKKSILDIDNEIQLTNISSEYPVYTGRNEICYKNTTDGLIYKKYFIPKNSLSSIETIQIPISRRQEFEKLILKIKPVNTWAGLMIEYI